MKALDRKLLRDLRQLRGQTVAIALVLVAGIATLVMSLTAYRALHDTRAQFYGEYRFAEVFARVVRAPWPLLEDLRRLPGVQRAEGRVVAGVNLEVAGFDDAVNGLVVSLPDARQGGQHRRRGREAPSVLGHHGAGTAVQVAGATVVPQPAPQGHHLVLGCRGEGMHVRKPAQEARVVAQDGAHLGLLQHDFGQPHAVGIAGALPGQAVPPVAALPMHQGRRKTSAHRAWNLHASTTSAGAASGDSSN